MLPKSVLRYNRFARTPLFPTQFFLRSVSDSALNESEIYQNFNRDSANKIGSPRKAFHRTWLCKNSVRGLCCTFEHVNGAAIAFQIIAAFWMCFTNSLLFNASACFAYWSLCFENSQSSAWYNPVSVLPLSFSKRKAIDWFEGVQRFSHSHPARFVQVSECTALSLTTHRTDFSEIHCLADAHKSRSLNYKAEDRID